MRQSNDAKRLRWPTQHNQFRTRGFLGNGAAERPLEDFTHPQTTAFPTPCRWALHKPHGGILLSDAPLVRQNASLRTCQNEPLSKTRCTVALCSTAVKRPFRPGSREGEVVESTLVLLTAWSQIDCSLLHILVLPSHPSPFVPRSPNTHGDVDCSFATETTMTPVDLLRLRALPGNTQRPLLDTVVPSRHMPMDADDEPDEQTHTSACVVQAWMVPFNPVVRPDAVGDTPRVQCPVNAVDHSRSPIGSLLPPTRFGPCWNAPLVAVVRNKHPSTPRVPGNRHGRDASMTQPSVTHSRFTSPKATVAMTHPPTSNDLLRQSPWRHP